MNSEAFEPVRREPPNRKAAGFLSLLILAVRAFLARFFAGKHPGNFDLEFGSWTLHDFSLVPGVADPPPRPLENKDCEKTYLIYNYKSVRVPQCTIVGQFGVAAQALGEIQTYFTNQFRCLDPNCPQPRAELVWVGLHCSPGPSDSGGVLVRLRCEPQIEA